MYVCVCALIASWRINFYCKYLKLISKTFDALRAVKGLFTVCLRL